MLRIVYWLQSKKLNGEWNDECWSFEIHQIQSYRDSCKFDFLTRTRIIVLLREFEY